MTNDDTYRPTESDAVQDFATLLEGHRADLAGASIDTEVKDAFTLVVTYSLTDGTERIFEVSVMERS